MFVKTSNIIYRHVQMLLALVRKATYTSFIKTLLLINQCTPTQSNDILTSSSSVLCVCVVVQIVFVTALFYLLDLSDESYLPVQWVMELVPQLTPEEGGSKQGEPFQRAIK